MARRAPTVPVSPQLLRHFAAGALALTFVIAIFANGSAEEFGNDLAERKRLSESDAKATGDKVLKVPGRPEGKAKTFYVAPVPGEGGVGMADAPQNDMAVGRDWGSGTLNGMQAVGAEQVAGTRPDLTREGAELTIDAFEDGPVPGAPQHTGMNEKAAKQAKARKAAAKNRKLTAEELEKLMAESAERAGPATAAEDAPAPQGN